MTSDEAFKLARENSLAEEYHGVLWKGLRTLGTLLYWVCIVYLLLNLIGWLLWCSR